MRVINFEDTPIKHNAIRNVLEEYKITDIDCVKNLEDGLEMYRKALETDQPYDLIITDMWYPPAQGAHEDRCGDKLINMALDEKWETPIIVCSNQNYDYPEIFGSLYYSENEDWEGKLRNYITVLRKRNG